jgi:hypothetical protein
MRDATTVTVVQTAVLIEVAATTVATVMSGVPCRRAGPCRGQTLTVRAIGRLDPLLPLRSSVDTLVPEVPDVVSYEVRAIRIARRTGKPTAEVHCGELLCGRQWMALTRHLDFCQRYVYSFAPRAYRASATACENLTRAVHSLVR